MWNIKYHKSIMSEVKNPTTQEMEMVSSIEPKIYPVYTEADRDYWVNIIKQSYGKYGEVTVEVAPDDRPKTKEELLEEQVVDLTEALINIQYEQEATKLNI